MESPTRSGDSNQAPATHGVEITVDKDDRQKQDKKVAREEERQDSEREESLLPPLPTERDGKQPAITSFFIKSPKNKGTERDSQESGPKKHKGKGKVTDVTNKQDVRKLLPRKSTRATPGSPIPDTPKSKDQGLALAQDEPTVEKEKSTKKQQVQKQVEIDPPAKTKAKGKGIVDDSRPQRKEKAKKSEKKEKEKQKKKRKTELGQIDMSETKETRTRRKLTDEKRQVPVVASQPEEAQVEEKR